MSDETQEYAPILEKTRNTNEQLAFYERLNVHIGASPETPLEKMMSFAAYTPRQVITSFVEKYELFKLLVNVPGSIFECGVAAGQGLFTFAHLCSIFEPYHYTRKIVGFDTFEGFTGLTDRDRTSGAEHMKDGGLRFDSYAKLQESIALYDMNRALGHLPKMALVKGDISKTLPAYIEGNPGTVIGLLYLDLDLYQPTKNAIAAALPRMPKGAILAFDELNHGDYPGETLAVMESIGLGDLRLQRFPASSMMSYAIIGD